MVGEMELHVRYFAWVRERVGTGSETLSLPDNVRTVGELIGWLRARGPRYDLAFQDPAAIRVAIDQEMVDPMASLENAGEVAFFPPMTGG